MSEEDLGNAYNDEILNEDEEYDDDADQDELELGEEWRERMQEQSELATGQQLDDEFCVPEYREYNPASATTRET